MPAWGNPYMPFRISTITWSSLTILGSAYCSIILAGMFLTYMRIYSYLFMGLFKYKYLMYVVMYLVLTVKMTLLRCNLTAASSAAGLDSLPFYLIMLTPTVNQVLLLGVLCVFFLPLPLVGKWTFSHRVC